MRRGMRPGGRSWVLILTGVLLGGLLVAPSGAHITSNNPKHNWTKHYKSLAEKVFFTRKQANNRFAPKSHQHDARYYTKTEADELFGLAGQSCPEGQFVAGFDEQGQPLCDGPPAESFPVPLNETDDAQEVDYCVIQFPAAESVGPGDPVTVFGRFFEDPDTFSPGPLEGWRAQLGLGPDGSDPRDQPGWTYVEADFNTEFDNDHEYTADLHAPTSPGTYRYVYRFSDDDFATATYCDTDGAGSNPDLTFDTSMLGTLTVT